MTDSERYWAKENLKELSIELLIDDLLSELDDIYKEKKDQESELIKWSTN